MDVSAAGATIGTLLRESGLPRREAEILLGSVLERERVHLIAHSGDALDPPTVRAARARFERRRSGEPIAYITGRREFYGLSLRVTPDVLIPRAETEQVVDLALERLSSASSARVLDLGTGSGAIALALATQRPLWKLVAADISEAALTIARRNAREHAVEIEFVRSDWFESIGSEPFDLIVSNPPYVAAGDPHLRQGDLPSEPRLALVDRAGGLGCIREIAAGARDRLNPGGGLLLEHGYDQGGRCVGVLRELGYAEVQDFPDLAGLARVCAATWRG